MDTKRRNLVIVMVLELIALVAMTVGFFQQRGLYQRYRQKYRDASERMAGMTPRDAASIPFHKIAALYHDPGPDYLTDLAFDDKRGALVLSFVIEGPWTATCDGKLLAIEGGSVVLPLELNMQAAGRVTHKVEVTTQRGKYAVDVEHYSPAYYRKIGVEDGGSVQVLSSMPRRLGLDYPTTEALESAQIEEMRQMLGGEELPADEGERHLAVAKRLLAKLARCKPNGQQLTPNRDGWVIMRELEEGKTSIQCSGMAVLVRDFELAFGLENRLVSLETAMVERSKGGVRVQASEGHALNEVRIAGKWCYVDLFNSKPCLYARLEGQSGWLSVLELLNAIQSRGGAGVLMGRYDAATGLVTETRLQDATDMQAAITRYFGGTVNLKYEGRRGRPKGG